ncbi:MAG TPA: hypothetical protein VM936_22825 [Pyrinomonadaceae bacterium]|nr:hypothetical protein [Pyrinomonadaceae bacterium]
MRTTRQFLILAAFLSALFLSAKTAGAQTAVSYRFLEVLDAGGKPVADAKVESVGSGGVTVKQTDERGQVRDMPVYSGDFNTHAFKISKPGYLTYELTELLERMGYGELGESFPRDYDEKTPVRVVLLKEPANAAEREAVEAERRGRELLRAVKAGDAAAAEKLLRAGVSPDAANLDGIPAVLFAAAKGDGAMIKALLAAGADVRNKGGPGRSALFHYVKSTRYQGVDVDVVRRLIKAGADVKAADKYGVTVLGFAKESRNPELVRLLEKAGAR